MKQHPMFFATMMALLQQDIQGGPMNLNSTLKPPSMPPLRDDKARKAKADAKRQRRLARNRALAAKESNGWK